MAANFVGFEATNVPEAEPDVDDQSHELQDVDMELGFGWIVGWFAICEGTKSNHGKAVSGELVAVYSPHEVVGGRPAAEAFVGCIHAGLRQ